MTNLYNSPLNSRYASREMSYIFSDDIEGAKKILKIDYPHTYVDFKENKELISRGNGELLKLMSSCKHFIIANSSISWWAAFLSDNENKIIITPTPWFRTRRVMGVETIDNKEPIRILNNDAEVFNNSDTRIYQLGEDEVLFNNLEYTKLNNYFKITQINENSNIILRNIKNTNNQAVIKLSLESNCFNCLKVYFFIGKNTLDCSNTNCNTNKPE